MTMTRNRPAGTEESASSVASTVAPLPVPSARSAPSAPSAPVPATPPPTGSQPAPGWLNWGLTTEHGGISDIARYLAYGPFAAGTQPYSYSVDIANFVEGDWPLPEGARHVRSVDGRQRSLMVAEGDGWTLEIVRWHGNKGQATATAVDLETATRISTEAAGLVSAEIQIDDDAVRMGFWYRAQSIQRDVRPIEAPQWTEIERNYARSAADQLERLMACGPEDVNGRLILLHGPPGTGKTTALRALGRAWQSWCRIDCVLDPDQLFNNSAYLMQVMVGTHHGAEADDRAWRLLIVEDCDELIRGEAKMAAGQALSRLLNVTDGLLGQGRNILIAITTNEPLGRLHPAVVRPGRCLAQVEVGALPRDEALAWLGDSPAPVGSGGATLAELYALRSGAINVPSPIAPPSGQYL
jgi:hypothetical protein